MLSLKALITTTFFTYLVSAQYSIDPNSVSLSTRQNWCNSQQTECPLICEQVDDSSYTESNSCNATTLAYSCVCGNGMSPNSSQYSETLPYFVCTEWGNQCVAACGNDNTCASQCRSLHPCGAQNPTRVNTSTISSTMSRTATGGSAATATSGSPVYTGYGGSAATSTSSSSSGASRVATAIQIGQGYGLVIVGAGLFGGFALLL